MSLLSALLSLIPGRKIQVTTPLPTFSPMNLPKDIPRLREDQRLTDSFLLSELTRTSNDKFQALNRTLTNDQVFKLTEVSRLLEKCRMIIGAVYNKPIYPIEVHSGYRCPELNGVTVGSSKTSQHMLCEAADWSPAGYETLDQLTSCFSAIREAAKRYEVKFGQLILEYAKRDYGVVYWIHVSLGFPYRDIGKCGEVLMMRNGIYTLLETIKPPKT